MDFSSAILSSITKDNYRYGTIRLRATEILSMSKATFTKHLEQLVTDEYVIKNDKGKQKIEYTINQDAVDMIQRLQKDHDGKRSKEFEKILRLDIDFSIISTKKRDEMIKYFDELLYTVLNQQNFATMIIHDPHQKAKVVNDAIRYRSSKDFIIELIFKIIKKINPDIVKLTQISTLHKVREKYQTQLNPKIILMMEKLGEKSNEKNNINR